MRLWWLLLCFCCFVACEDGSRDENVATAESVEIRLLERDIAELEHMLQGKRSRLALLKGDRVGTNNNGKDKSETTAAKEHSSQCGYEECGYHEISEELISSLVTKPSHIVTVSAFLPFSSPVGIYRYLVTGDDKGNLHFYARSGGYLGSYDTGHNAAVTAISVAAKTDTSMPLVTGAADGSIRYHTIIGPPRRTQQIPIKNRHHRKDLGQYEQWTPEAKLERIFQGSHETGEAAVAITAVDAGGRGKLHYVASGDAKGNFKIFFKNGTMVSSSSLEPSSPIGCIVTSGNLWILCTNGGIRFVDLREKKISEARCVDHWVDENGKMTGATQDVTMPISSLTFDINNGNQMFAATSDGRLLSLMLKTDRARVRCTLITETTIAASNEAYRLGALRGYIVSASPSGIRVFNVSNVHKSNPPTLIAAGSLPTLKEHSHDVVPGAVLALETDKRHGMIISTAHGVFAIYESTLPFFENKGFSFGSWSFLQHPMLIMAIGLFIYWQYKKKTAASNTKRPSAYDYGMSDREMRQRLDSLNLRKKYEDVDFDD